MPDCKNCKMREAAESSALMLYMAQAERRDRIHWIVHFIMLAALVATMFLFVWYIDQYDFVSYEIEQDSAGVNIVGYGNGVGYYVSESDYQNAHEKNRQCERQSHED